jgi:ankyrin repeat protein
MTDLYKEVDENMKAFDLSNYKKENSMWNTYLKDVNLNEIGDDKLEEELNRLVKKNELKELINERNYEGYTPLHCAILNKNQKCAQQLIDHGADINIPTDDGYKIKWISKNKQKGGGVKKQISGRRFL